MHNFDWMIPYPTQVWLKLGNGSPLSKIQNFSPLKKRKIQNFYRKFHNIKMPGKWCIINVAKGPHDISKCRRVYNQMYNRLNDSETFTHSTDIIQKTLSSSANAHQTLVWTAMRESYRAVGWERIDERWIQERVAVVLTMIIHSRCCWLAILVWERAVSCWVSSRIVSSFLIIIPQLLVCYMCLCFVCYYV